MAAAIFFILFFENKLYSDETFESVGLCLFFNCFGSVNLIFGQTRQIIGTVISSENRQPLQGVTVSVKGSQIATSTDANGKFKISVDNKSAVWYLPTFHFKHLK
ncbi:MAG: carboxypeptidase-like regulatory domain-containing protein [Chitinophagaceae bacterium]|nr:carboxypeptidase-like regulatory domain-containing protein [Chitinophagaceae bacterium]